MNEAIRHRGPDDSGAFFSDDFSLGHVRLSILDLSPLGHQPMSYEHNGKKLSIVFNGEIYNYQEIRDDLIAKGYSFRSTSDTEVILATYLEYGEDCVLQFNGMWAFCIYDHQRHSFFCSRDRFGKKPFYYYFKDGIFIFSSELKGILSHASLNINTQENIDENAVDLYFSLGFVPAPLSIYQNVYKLEARHNLVFDLSEKKLRTWQYYEIPKYTPCYDRKKLIQEGREILADAVKIRMRSDVPVGAFLSGGLDSSTVVGMMKGLTDVEKLHTFSIGFEGRYDETKYINIVKDYFHTKHHHEYFRESDFEGVIDSYMYAYDEPFGDFGGFPTLKVSEMAKKEVTVVLTGDGGDEVFGGYLNHTVGVKMDLIRKIPGVFRRIISKIPAKKQLNGISSFYAFREACRVSLFLPEFFYATAFESDGIKLSPYKEWSVDKLKKALLLGANRLGEALRLYDLLFASLPDLFLVKVDRAGMLHGLESRSPFLDYRLVEFAQKIPTYWKQDIFRTKILMREIIDGILPHEIIHRGKQGFTPPLESWIMGGKYDAIIQSGVDRIKNRKYLHSLYVRLFLKEKNSVYSHYLIRLFLFEKWAQKWIDKDC